MPKEARHARSARTTALRVSITKDAAALRLAFASTVFRAISKRPPARDAARAARLARTTQVLAKAHAGTVVMAHTNPSPDKQSAYSATAAAAMAKST